MILKEIDLGLIHPNVENIRRDIGNVNELAASIKSVGILEPLVICPVEVGNGYTLIAGHRRLEAAKKAKLAFVPCRVLEPMTRAQSIELMLVENLQRSDITPVEEACAYQELLQFDGYDEASIAKATGRSVKTVRSRVQLMRLPEKAIDQVHNGQMTLDHAHKLAEFADNPEISKTLLESSAGNFDYQYRTAKDRAKKIAAARKAGAEVYTDEKAMRKAHPYLEPTSWGTKPAPGIAVLFDGLYSEQSFEILTSRPSKTEKEQKAEAARLKRQDELRAREQAVAQAKTAQLVQLAFVGQQLQEKRLRDAAVLNSFRSVATSMGTGTHILRILGVELEKGWASQEDLDTHAQPVIDKLDLPKLVLLVVASDLASSAARALQNTQDTYTGLDTLREGVRWFEFLISIGYDLNDVDQAKLTEIEKRIALIESATKADAQ